MAENPPYLVSPGSLAKALDKIKAAATPERVTGDFIATVIGMKGGAGAAIIPFLKRIGFVKSDGSPSELYNQFRNPSSSKKAAAAAFRIGYKQLFDRNEYIHKASDEDFKGIVVEATGLAHDNRVVSAIVGTAKVLKSYCDFDSAPASTELVVQQKVTETEKEPERETDFRENGIGMNLSYTINLNLPATDDVKVFDAIFKSLKEHLLKN